MQTSWFIKKFTVTSTSIPQSFGNTTADEEVDAENSSEATRVYW